jgi:DNA polymerase
LNRTSETHTLHLDFETRSAVELKTAGVYRYAEDPTTDVQCAAFAIDDSDVFLWRRTDTPPIAIGEFVRRGWPIVAHNANFESVIWQHILTPRYGWPTPKPEQWRCTMSMALAMALPASLENCAAALSLTIPKDMVGRGLMLRMARPRSLEPLTWWEDSEKLERLHEYCRTDVEVERLLFEKLMPLSEAEQALWRLDQVINGRGVQVDVPLCDNAKRIVKAATVKADARMKVVTAGEVQKCTEVGRLAKWFRGNGGDAQSLAKDKLIEILARDDLAPNVREALELRAATAKTSVAKIDALLAGMSLDGRARGLLQFHAASTGRWGGRRFQPQNLKRPSSDDVSTAIELVGYGSLDLIETVYDEPLSVVGDCIRGMVCAASCTRLMAADFSNIEGRVLAWLAGENWKLRAFRDYDEGKGPDLYQVAYGRSFGVDPESVTKAQRQIGKVQELALGYQGGPGAFAAMAKTYGVDIAESYDLITATSPGLVEQAQAAYESRGKQSGMGERAWVTAEIIKRRWRAAHEGITSWWKDLERGAMEAISNTDVLGRDCETPRGQKGALKEHPVIYVEPVKMRKSGSFLWVRLPSGRSLCYPFPHYAMKAMPWVDEEGDVVVRRVFAYKGMDTFTKQWTEQYAYGGLWAENITQAVARDIMAEAMVRLEAAGYPVVLSVHDEVVCEVPLGFGNLENFKKIMTEIPKWAFGLPIAASAWSGERYKK